jgi:hypothetical protein
MNAEHPLRVLEALGAGAFVHVNGSLAAHLHGTHALLKRWGNRDALCRAGLYHAVYGTAGIRGSLASVAMRDAIANVIGNEAERLAYLYGACARDAFHPRIGTPDQLDFPDRFTEAQHPISAPDLRDFCEITLANELELSLGSEAFLVKHRAELIGLFERMRGLVSEAAFETCRRTFRPAGAEAHRAARERQRADAR